MNPTSVLVVDDDPSGRAMLGLSLRQEGLNVQTAAGAEEALRLLKGQRFDWLITDASMFPVSGFALARDAKRLQPDLHVVMVSGVYTERDAASYPIEKFFSKPIPIETLVDWISTAS